MLLFQSKEEVSGYWFVVLWVILSSGESIFWLERSWLSLQECSQGKHYKPNCDHEEGPC